MLNLCVLINSLTIGGAEKLAVTLYDEYREKGINVIFVCLEKNNFFEIDEENIHYLSNHTGEKESVFRKFFNLIIYARRLKLILKEQRISLVQSHIYRANYVNVLAKLLGSPHKTQLVNHGIVSRYKSEGLSGRINLFLVKHLYARADQLVFPSQGMKDDLERLGTFTNKKTVIHNPFDVSQVLELKDAPLEHDEFQFESAKKYLVAAGRFEKVKRYGDILKALVLLRESGVEPELILLGDGPEEEYLVDLAARSGLQGSVHFPGRVTNPFKYISRADVFVSTSEYEGFSNVIVEALICGTPVVSTDCESGPREILAPKSGRGVKIRSGQMEFAEFGVLVPVGDVTTIADAIMKLLSDQNMMGDYSTRGVLRTKDFDKTAISEQYVESMKALMDE